MSSTKYVIPSKSEEVNAQNYLMLKDMTELLAQLSKGVGLLTIENQELKHILNGQAQLISDLVDKKKKKVKTTPPVVGSQEDSTDVSNVINGMTNLNVAPTPVKATKGPNIQQRIGAAFKDAAQSQFRLDITKLDPVLEKFIKDRDLVTPPKPEILKSEFTSFWATIKDNDDLKKKIDALLQAPK